MKCTIALLLIFLRSVRVCEAFSAPFQGVPAPWSRGPVCATVAQARHHGSMHTPAMSMQSIHNRRRLLWIGAGVCFSALIRPRQRDRADARDHHLPPPVAVLGADGETGARVVDILVSKGVPVRCVRHRVDPARQFPRLVRGIPVENVVARVEDAAEVAKAVRGAQGVICVVGIKPRIDKGVVQEFDTGDDVATFTEGYAVVAAQCIRHAVPRLAILDSTCTYPSNTCRSMALGEVAVRALYAKAPQGCGYTIVRAGRLYNGESRGPEEIEVNQGRGKSGLLSRQDLAHLLVEEILDTHAPGSSRRTLEAHYTDSAQPVDLKDAVSTCEANNVTMKDCFLGVKDRDGRTVVFPTGKERHSRGHWRSLFLGLKEDASEEEDGKEDGNDYTFDRLGKGFM